MSTEEPVEAIFKQSFDHGSCRSTRNQARRLAASRLGASGDAGASGAPYEPWSKLLVRGLRGGLWHPYLRLLPGFG